MTVESLNEKDAVGKVICPYCRSCHWDDYIWCYECNKCVPEEEQVFIKSWPDDKLKELFAELLKRRGFCGMEGFVPSEDDIPANIVVQVKDIKELFGPLVPK